MVNGLFFIPLTISNSDELFCYCNKNLTYGNCCAKIHADITLAKTAEDLMRSRYSAFVLGKINYLMESHHSSTRLLNEKADIETWAKSVQWKKLQILDTVAGLENDEEGTVRFAATFKKKNKLKTIRENSKFVKENGHWVYDGEV